MGERKRRVRVDAGIELSMWAIPLLMCVDRHGLAVGVLCFYLTVEW